MMQQPVPSEINTKQAEQWQYTPDFVIASFKPVLLSLGQAVRTERGVTEFLSNQTWIVRILLILEEWTEPEVVSHGVKVISRLVQQPNIINRLA